MPNWASSKVTITGDHKVVSQIKEKLAKPYQSPFADDKENIEGVFLLWNIVSPTNLRAYTGQEKEEFEELMKANNLVPDNFAETKQALEIRMAEFQEKLQSGDFITEIRRQMAESDEWYEWNCRNWGTKWEIAGRAFIEFEIPVLGAVDDTSLDTADYNLEITYRMESAWSPPYEALQKLAEQHPEVAISLVSIDESDCWAMGAEWANGREMVEDDLEITHDLGMDLRGYCNLECCNDYE